MSLFILTTYFFKLVDVFFRIGLYIQDDFGIISIVVPYEILTIE